MTEESTEKQNTNTEKHHQEDSLAGKIFWGLLLVMIGGLILASNFGLVGVSWSGIWRLWPIFIIFAGVSILSIKHFVWRIVSVVLAVATVGLIAWVAIGGLDDVGFGDVKDYNEVVHPESNNVKSAKIGINAGASDIDVSTVDQLAIADVSFSSVLARLAHSSVVSNDVQTVNFSMESSGLWAGNPQNNWNVKLTQNMPISLELDAGASSIDIDLSEATVSLVDIDMGASDLELRLGDEQKNMKVELNSGASSIKILIPESTGVNLHIDDGLTSKALDGLKLVSDGIYQTDNYSTATKTIDITANVGVSSFAVERY